VKISSSDQVLPVFLILLQVFLAGLASAQTEPSIPQPLSTHGADQHTPSKSEYFTWIENWDDGPTAQGTLTDLAFFKWLRDEYGAQLDLYAFDVGTIDGAEGYGSLDSSTFKSHFPDGFKPISKASADGGIRLGLWCGSNGFGDTPEQNNRRKEFLVSLVRDFNFGLFKFDAYGVGGPDPKKLPYLADTLKECRTYLPDLVVLNHRLDLGPAMPYTTTSLWQGQETYIDVHISNDRTALHHREGALNRDVPPLDNRLLEDHGVCFSSCLDYWEDDVVLQAFNRSLILAPEIYGSPWFLRDNEYPLLARFFNLHRRFGKVLATSALALPESDYGAKAVSRGDDTTRFVTLRNLSWLPVTHNLKLDVSIGLKDNGQPIEVRRFHPNENILGHFSYGQEVPVKVLPFRSALFLASNAPLDEIGVTGCDYQVSRDLPKQPVTLRLLGLPGTRADIVLSSGNRKFSIATLDGSLLPGFTQGQTATVQFPGHPLHEDWERKLASLQSVPVPSDAEALYEASVFAADNNPLEIRALQRSGPTHIPQVQAARDAFLNQPQRDLKGLTQMEMEGGWDHFMFDGKPATSFKVRDYKYQVRPINGGSLRIDFGQPETMDKMVLHTDRAPDGLSAEVSSDLHAWNKVHLAKTSAGVEIQIPAGQAIRYLRVTPTIPEVSEAEGFLGDQSLDRSKWRGSNLFGPYAAAPASHAWSASFTLDEVPVHSYLAIAINGEHGCEGTYAAIRVNGIPVGAPDRAESYISNAWEGPVGMDGGPARSNYTYYVPLTPQMAGKNIDAVVLQLGGTSPVAIVPEVWITAYPAPFVEKQLVLH
jgi:hypothetical protein